MVTRASRAGGAILVALLVAACGLAAPSASPRRTEAGVVIPPPPAPAEVLACLGINPVECALVASTVLAELPPDRGDPFSMRVRLSGCDDAANACPESLAVREGTALVEYGDQGTPFEYRVVGPPARPGVERIELGPGAWTDPIQPGSPQVDAAGPFTLEVGHCGLLHVVDFDGSFWVLVGDAPGDHPALDGSETGSIRLIDQDRAEYAGSLDATIGLARFPGAKRFPLCR